MKDIVNASAEFAQSSPEPDASELYTDYCKLKTRGAAVMDIKPIVAVAILKIRRSPSYV